MSRLTTEKRSEQARGSGRRVPLSVYTVGHSTRSFRDFTRLLTAHGIQQIVDVRTVPRSRKNPQFNKETLPKKLRKSRIAYKHLKGLGGLRHPQPDSPNMGWRNSSFRGFADYMQTSEFRANIKTLIALATNKRTAIMCAEALPWRCHRSLIADALTARRINVYHIMSPTNIRPHTVTSFARVKGTGITYPPDQ